MAKTNVEVIKESAIVQIDVSGAYYNRVVDLMSRLIEKQPDPKQSITKINTEGETLTISEAVIQTYMMLIKSVEDAVNNSDEDLNEEIEIELPTEDPSEN